MNFIQVKLNQNNKQLVAWIQSKYAIIGKKLQTESLEGIWVVIEKYDTKSEEEVKASERLYLKHRLGSDI